jgi:hypothetical protein
MTGGHGGEATARPMHPMHPMRADGGDRTAPRVPVPDRRVWTTVTSHPASPTTDRIMASGQTEAPHSSPWLPAGFLQNLKEAA